MIVAGDQQLLKQINRMALVRQLCARPGLSRADLAACVQLTKSTVGLLVSEDGMINLCRTFRPRMRRAELEVMLGPQDDGSSGGGCVLARPFNPFRRTLAVIGVRTKSLPD